MSPRQYTERCAQLGVEPLTHTPEPAAEEAHTNWWRLVIFAIALLCLYMFLALCEFALTNKHGMYLLGAYFAGAASLAVYVKALQPRQRR